MSAYNAYTYIQLITDTDGLEGSAIYRWGSVESLSDWQDAQRGGEEELMAWLQRSQQAVVLIIPSEKVVCHHVPFDEKNNRHFLKALPYEIEDHVMGDVEELHFAVGVKQAPQATIAYVNQQWFTEFLQKFIDQDVDIIRCIADFQLLTTAADEKVFWFKRDRLLAHTPDGLGFSTSQDLAPIVLQNILANNEHKLTVYMTDDVYQPNTTISSRTAEDYDDVKLLFHTLATDAECEFHTTPPSLSINNSQNINFCSGLYRKKLPVAQWFKEFRGVAMLAVATIATFFVVNIVDATSLSSANKKKRQEIEQAYRTVIPRGVVNDPVRQLTRKLGRSSSNEKPSQAVYLLSIVAPAVQGLGVDMSTINYNNKNRQMSINVQANSFNDVEKLRSEIASKGLNAQLLSSNAVDDKYQARLRIELGDK